MTQYEYIVTLNNYDDLEEFYNDMETPGGNLYIPDREVECAVRRNISRNTHYMLTEEEADEVRNDPRVLACEKVPSLLGMSPSPMWTQTDAFEKSGTVNSTDKNWGLARVIGGEPVSGWGTDGSFTEYTTTIQCNGSGKNVDVVIVDAHINPNHPEFAVNPDGTGGSRVNLYDWFLHSADVGVSTTGSYDYSNISSNHGTHVAGTCVGNTQGWARDANIYSMEFNYSGSNAPPGDWALYVFDYIRYWHRSKPVNSATGIKNPTITNNSWGYAINQVFLSAVNSVGYQGSIVNLIGLNDADKKTALEQNGVPVPFNTYLYKIPGRVAALEADIIDAISDGVIVVSSAGNSSWQIANPTDNDYNQNYVSISGIGNVYHMRGSSPGADTNVICVGSIGTSTSEYKATYSNYGPRVDVYAPGSNIISSVYDTTAASEFGISLVDDPRNSAYKLGSIDGTSMAGPQVAGYLACLLESQPTLDQNECQQWIEQSSTKDQITSTGGGFGDYTSLGTGSNNRYLYFYKIRQPEGQAYPNAQYKYRRVAGVVYPRPKITRTVINS